MRISIPLFSLSFFRIYFYLFSFPFVFDVWKTVGFNQYLKYLPHSGICLVFLFNFLSLSPPKKSIPSFFALHPPRSAIYETCVLISEEEEEKG